MPLAAQVHADGAVASRAVADAVVDKGPVPLVLQPLQAVPRSRGRERAVETVAVADNQVHQAVPVKVALDDSAAPVFQVGRLPHHRVLEPPAPEVSAERLSDAVAEGFPALDMGEVDGLETAETPQDQTPRDSIGTPFDPSRHKVGDDGKPLLNDAGRFVRMNRRKAEAAQAAPAAPAIDQYAQAAQIISMIEIRIMGIVFDPEEAKPDPEFQKAFLEAWTLYLRTAEISLLSPGWSLVAMHAAFVAGVVEKPKSKEKAKKIFGRVFEWVKSKFKRE